MLPSFRGTNVTPIACGSFLTVLDVILPLPLVARTVGIQKRTSSVSPASLQLPDVAATGRVREHTALLLALETIHGFI